MKTIKMFKLTLLAVLAIIFVTVFISTSYGAETKAGVEKKLQALQLEINQLQAEFQQWKSIQVHHQAIVNAMAEKANRIQLRANQIRVDGDNLKKQLQAFIKAEVAEKEAQIEKLRPKVEPGAKIDDTTGG